MCDTMKQTLHETFLTYTTVKLVKVPNTTIAIINRILQFLIFTYIALYIVWWKKGYQEFQEPRGTSVIKIKGIARVVGNNATRYVQADSHLWDTADYQIPPIENNAFFLATRQVFTYNQKEGNCPSALDDKLFCNDTTPDACPKDQPIPNTFGYYTGNCVNSTENSSIKVCEINAWCPEELADSTEYVLNSADLESFTIYLKTIVTFGIFKPNLRNIPAKTNFSCRYDPINDPNCPIIRIGLIFDSFRDQTNIKALLHEGGLIEIRQDWTCNFDYNVKNCYPKLEFSVLQSGDDPDSPGINYRYSQNYRINDIDYRTLSKVYGLRFVVSISGKGGRFNIVNLFVAIGSGIGFMVIAGIVCDFIFMYFHTSREQYRQRKFSVCDVDKKRAISNENLVR